MEALILAAGLGTRLRPLTDDKPKALVTVNGRTLLERNIGHLADAGVSRCVVNTHYKSRMLKDYIANHRWPCEVIVSDESETLLDTGGAIAHAATLFSGDQPVLVHNVDILSDVDLEKLQAQHLEKHNDVTLCVCQRQSSRGIMFDENGLLSGVNDRGNGIEQFPFSGIHLISPRVLSLLPDHGTPYPILPFYLEHNNLLRIGYFLHPLSRWVDVGTMESLHKAELLWSDRSEETPISQSFDAKWK